MQAKDVQIFIEGRFQYISFVWFGTEVRAGRYEVCAGQYSPWVITTGREVLPMTQNKRGRLISRLFHVEMAKHTR